MDKKSRILRRAIIISTIILWLTINLYYFWVKVAGGIFLATGIIVIICILIVVVATIIMVIKIISKPNYRNLKNYLTIGFPVLVFIVLNIKQLRAGENTFQSPVVIRACYEGTMNTSRLYFRKNGTFEDFNIGLFAFIHYCGGTWEQNGDTLILDFHGEKPKLLEEKIVIKNKSLYTIQADTLAPIFYYIGYCKGLN